MGRVKPNFPWIGAAIGAACLVLVGAYLVNVTNPGRLDATALPRGGDSSVTLVPIDSGETREERGTSAELSLLDPTPLFLPTIYNSGRVDVSMTKERSPGASFVEIEPKMVFEEGSSPLDVPDIVKIHDNPLDALEDLAPPIVLAELPRKDFQLSTLPSRGALIEVKRVADGEVLWRQVLDQSSPGLRTLIPIEMMVVVDSAGFVTSRGILSVAAGGEAAAVFGERQVDLAATGELLEQAALGRRLSAGIYRISLGP